MNDSQDRTVLILGARGRFGLAAARAFAAAGWQVLAQGRAGASGPPVAGVKWLAQDPQDTAALAAAAQGAAVVVHAINPPYVNSQWLKQAPRLMDSAIALSRALHATLMLPGNVYNYGTNLPAVLTEDTPQVADTVKGRVRIGMEQQLAQAAGEGLMKAVVIRAGDFFGSGRGTWLDQLFVPGLPKGKLTLPGPLDSPGAWAYLPDLARTFVAVAERRAQLPAFETLHFAGYTLTGQDWRDVMTDQAWEHGWLPAGGQLRLAAMPWPLIRAGAWLMPTWASLCEMQYLWRRPHRLANDKLVALLGHEPHTPLAQAVGAALEDLGLLRPAGCARLQTT